MVRKCAIRPSFGNSYQKAYEKYKKVLKHEYFVLDELIRQNEIWDAVPVMEFFFKLFYDLTFKVMKSPKMVPIGIM